MHGSEAQGIRINGDRLNAQIAALSAFGRNADGGIDRVAYSEADRAGRAWVTGLMREAAELLGVVANLEPEHFITDQAYIGEGYGIPTAGGVEAIRLLARSEGVLLDPVYTSKAMAGLIDHIRNGLIDPMETVVFLHSGGAPGFFAQSGTMVEMMDRTP